MDVQNAVIGIQQARARYDAATGARTLSQQTFDADKKKYELGAGTPYQVVQDQRDLASAQSSELQAMANYSHARIAFDQALGRTLEVNHISMDEAISGHVIAAPITRGRRCGRDEDCRLPSDNVRRRLGSADWHRAGSPLRAHSVEIFIALWEVPPIRLSDSDRSKVLIRAGKLYLSVQDALALALENNIDIESARYNASLLAWNLERSQAGGALPGVPSGATQSASVQNGQGVRCSQQAAGVSLPGSRGGSSSVSNATVAQVGPVTPELDPSIQETTAFSHRSNPQPLTTLSLTPNLSSGAADLFMVVPGGFSYRRLVDRQFQ